MNADALTSQVTSGPDSHGRRVTWLELFFDLIFVAAVTQVAEPLRHHYTWHELARLAPLFLLICLAWKGQAVYATRFGTNEPGQRALTLVQMFTIAVMAANAKDSLSSESTAGFVAAYAALRLMLVGQYFVARRSCRSRALLTRYLAGHGVAAALWLASAVVPAPWRFVVWAVAATIDLLTPWMAVSHTVELPPDQAHLPERLGLGDPGRRDGRSPAERGRRRLEAASPAGARDARRESARRRAIAGGAQRLAGSPDAGPTGVLAQGPEGEGAAA